MKKLLVCLVGLVFLCGWTLSAQAGPGLWSEGKSDTIRAYQPGEWQPPQAAFGQDDKPSGQSPEQINCGPDGCHASPAPGTEPSLGSIKIDGPVYLPIEKPGIKPVERPEKPGMPDAYGWQFKGTRVRNKRGVLSIVKTYYNAETQETIKVITTIDNLRGRRWGNRKKDVSMTTTLVYENADGERQEVVLSGPGVNWQFAEAMQTTDYPSSHQVFSYINPETGEKFAISFMRGLDEKGDDMTTVRWEYTNSEGEGFQITFESGTITENLFSGSGVITPIPEPKPFPRPVIGPPPGEPIFD